MPTYGWGANEPEIKLVAQGGDTVATYATKVKNAISNLFNTLNTFPWANATQSSAGFMSSDDKKAVDGIANLGTFNKMFFSQTSGSYIAPRTGVYRITLKGGGGGGFGADNTIQWTGAGGGEGGTLVFYTQLTKNAVYPYVIGAGGAAGTNKLNASGTAGYGAAGGTTSFDSAYTVSGAGATLPAGTTTRGGAGGRTYTVPAGSTAHFIPGASGAAGLGYYGNPDGTGNDTLVNSLGYSVGGGHGGGFYDSPAVYGGGGGGGKGTTQPSAGGAGYILIEYAG